MTMTDAEIVRHYQEAANKTKDIKVLAELNLCAPADIRAILAAAGVPGVKAPTRQGQRPVPPRLAKAELDTREKSRVPERGTIYDRIETILAALPPDMPEATRREAGDLLLGLFADYLAIRLGEADHGA